MMLKTNRGAIYENVDAHLNGNSLTLYLKTDKRLPEVTADLDRVSRFELGKDDASGFVFTAYEGFTELVEVLRDPLEVMAILNKPEALYG